MNFLRGYGQGLLGGLLGAAFVFLLPLAFRFTHEASQDIVRDVHALHVQLDGLEKALGADLKAVKGQVEGLLTLKTCTCLDGNKPSPGEPTVSQWYRSRTNFNLLYYGYIGKDGTLYYSYWSINGQVIKSGKQTNETTNDFLPTPIDKEKN